MAMVHTASSKVALHPRASSLENQGAALQRILNDTGTAALFEVGTHVCIHLF